MIAINKKIIIQRCRMQNTQGVLDSDKYLGGRRGVKRIRKKETRW